MFDWKISTLYYILLLCCATFDITYFRGIMKKSLKDAKAGMFLLTFNLDISLVYLLPLKALYSCD